MCKLEQGHLRYCASQLQFFLPGLMSGGIGILEQLCCLEANRLKLWVKCGYLNHFSSEVQVLTFLVHQGFDIKGNRIAQKSVFIDMAGYKSDKTQQIEVTTHLLDSTFGGVGGGGESLLAGEGVVKFPASAGYWDVPVQVEICSLEVKQTLHCLLFTGSIMKCIDSKNESTCIRVKPVEGVKAKGSQVLLNTDAVITFLL